MNATLQSVSVNIPQSDMRFFNELVAKMGWTLNTRESLLNKYLLTRPQNVDLSDEDIMAELNAVRYK